MKPRKKLGHLLVTLSLVGALSAPMTNRSRAMAEEIRGSKGPDGAAMPDIDDMLSSDAGNVSGSQSGEEGLGDLEKVISDEDKNAAASGSTLNMETEDSPPAEKTADAADLDSLEKDMKSEGSPSAAGSESLESDKRDTAAASGPEPLPDPGPPSQASPEQPPEAPPATGEKNRISNLEFRMEGKNSRLVLTSARRLMYRDSENPKMKQLVVIFENTETPEKLQRAYDTTEFPSPVALFTLLQVPGAPVPTSKLIIQLRENQKARFVASDRGMTIEFPPPSEGSDTKVAVGDRDRQVLLNEDIYSGKQVFRGQILRRLEIKNADIQDVLRLIAKVSGYSIVIGEEVNGKVGTLSLENIPWDQAFTLILQTKKLGYLREGNVLRINTNNALKAEKDEALAIEQARLRVEPLRTVLIPVSYAKATELLPKAKAFLSERGNVDSDLRTNTLIVKDVEKTIERLQKLVTALDTPPARISIAAKFVEIQKGLTRQLGITRVQSAINPEFAGIDIASTFNPGSNGGNFLTTLTASQLGIVNLQLQMGEAESRSRTLANPSISVVANQAATITQGITFFIPTTQVANGLPINGNQTVSANLSLNVTPIVSGDGSIFMTVKINNDIPHISGTNTTIDTRNIDTQVLVENGDTAVIGGVFHHNIDTSLTGIPLLMRIPLIGYLFSTHTNVDDQNELFIFLTARIMNAEDSFKRSL